MMSNINYKDTLFERSELTPIHGEPTFETLHNLWFEIIAKSKSVYSNIGGGAHVHLGLVLIYAQYALISPTPFVYSTHPGLIIIPDGTTTHANSNIRIVQIKIVHMFQELMRVEQALVQEKFATVKEM